MLCEIAAPGRPNLLECARDAVKEYQVGAKRERERDAARSMRWLWRRPETDIAVVTHWVFLSHLFRQFPALEALQSNFGNAEHRAVTLVAEDTGAASAPGTERDEL